MGFIFLHSCFMGFIFLWFWLWVHLISFVLTSISVLASVSAVWSRSRRRAGSGIERMELSLGLRLCQNGARSQPPSWSQPSSRPKWSSISAFAQSVNDCEIPLPLSFLINDGGSGFGYFVGVGLLTDRWGGSLVCSVGWWWFDCVG